MIALVVARPTLEPPAMPDLQRHEASWFNIKAKVSSAVSIIAPTSSDKLYGSLKAPLIMSHRAEVLGQGVRT